MRYLKTCLLAFLISLSLSVSYAETREKLDNLFNTLAFQKQRITESFDYLSQDYYDGKIPYEKLEDFIHEAALGLKKTYMDICKLQGDSDEEAQITWSFTFLEEKEDLMARHKRRARLQGLGLPLYEINWWLSLAELPPESRAELYWNRWQEESPKERAKLERVLQKAPGVATEEFKRHLRVLRRKRETKMGLYESTLF